MSEERGPDIVIYHLTEGFILDNQGYTIALTSAEDLAKRVQEIAEKLEGRGSEIPAPSQPEVPQPTAPEVKARTNLFNAQRAAAADIAPAAGLSEEKQWANVHMLNEFLARGAMPDGKVFLRTDWDKALPEFAPNIDPQQAEFVLSEYLASLHEDDD